MRQDSAAKKETAEIPQAMRVAVDERDGGYCRMCGRYLGGRRAIHHIFFGGDLQGMGGRRRHDLDNLVSLCWLPWDGGCHMKAHADKGLWQPLLHAAITSKRRTTAYQLARYLRKAQR